MWHRLCLHLCCWHCYELWFMNDILIQTVFMYVFVLMRSCCGCITSVKKRFILPPPSFANCQRELQKIKREDWKNATNVSHGAQEIDCCAHLRHKSGNFAFVARAITISPFHSNGNVMQIVLRYMEHYLIISPYCFIVVVSIEAKRAAFSYL